MTEKYKYLMEILEPSGYIAKDNAFITQGWPAWKTVESSYVVP